MRKFLVLSSWSRKAIGSMLIMAFTFVGCDDSSSASAGPNDEPGVESSSSSGKVTEPAEETSSSSEKAKSSSSSVPSSSSAESSSSSSVILSASEESSSSSVKSSSSVTPQSSSSSIIVSSSSSVDGKVYRTVTIGKQAWMAENLNYYDSTDLSVKKKSWCFGKKDNGDSSTCDVAGRLYTWAAAMDSAGVWSTNGKGCGYNRPCSSTAPVRGICPEGWHLPTSYEFDLLRIAVGTSTSGKELKSTSGWDDYDGESGNGTDSFGFSALPAGYGNINGYFDNDGKYAHFWTSTDFNIYNAYLLTFYYNLDETRSSYTETEVIFSVRHKQRLSQPKAFLHLFP